MASITNVLVGIFEEQAALLQKHIAVLKANAILEQAPNDGANEKKKAQKIVDPDMPKKAPNAYFVYLSENQAPFKASNPTMSQAEIMATLGKRWTSLTSDVKGRYNKQAEVLKVSQQEKIAAYVATKTTSSSSSAIVVKAPKLAKSPKVVPSPVIVATDSEVVAPVIEVPIKTIASEPSLVIFAPMSTTTLQTLAVAEKEHKIKKKKRKSEAAAAAAAVGSSVEFVPVAAVIESLPIAVPESEKKKVSLPFHESSFSTSGS